MDGSAADSLRPSVAVGWEENGRMQPVTHVVGKLSASSPLRQGSRAMLLSSQPQPPQQHHPRLDLSSLLSDLLQQTTPSATPHFLGAGLGPNFDDRLDLSG